MKRNILLIFVALIFAFSMTACRQTIFVPIPGGDNIGSNPVISATEAMERISEGLNIASLLNEAKESAKIDGNTLAVDITNKSFTDSDGETWMAKSGTLLYEFNETEVNTMSVLDANSNEASYKSYTVSTDPDNPIVLSFRGNTYTYTIANSEPAACDVTISSDSVTINSITSPEVSGTINGTSVQTPSTAAPVTAVSNETALIAALSNGGNIEIAGDIVASSSQLSVVKDGTHIFSTASTKPVVTGTIAITADDVVIENVDFKYGGTGSSSSSHILKASYDGETAIDGLVIRNAVFTLGEGAGLNLHGTRNAVLENVKVDGSNESKNVALTISDSLNLYVSGSFDNGDISVGGGAYKFADIQINYNAGDKFYDNKTSSVTFGEIGDSVVYSTEAPNGGNIVNGLGEGIRFVNTNEAGYYYNAPSDWDYLMSFDAKNELKEKYIPALFSMFNALDSTSTAKYYDSKQLDKYFNESEPYIDLGDHGTVGSVTLLGKEYKPGNTDTKPFAISIGKNNFYKDAVVKIDGENNHLLVNKAWLVFSLLYSDTICINDVEYKCDLGYGDVEPLDITSVKVGDTVVSADNSGIYTIELSDSTTRVAYTYEGQGEKSSDVFIITEDIDGEVSQISIESSDTPDFGSYPLPYGEDIDTLKSEYEGKLSKKIGYVLDESGNLGRFELDMKITFA